MYVNSSDWKWLLDSFADRVANKEYKKTDYQYWRRLKNYDSAHIYYINGHNIVVEDAEKDLVENVEVFSSDDGSFGSYLAEHWLREENSMDFETGSTSAASAFAYGNYDLDSCAAIKNIGYDGITDITDINGCTINSISVDKINKATPSIDISFDHLATKDAVDSVCGAVDSVCEKINELKAKIETKLDKAEYYSDNDNEKEKKSMNMFKGFEFGKVDGNKVRMSMYGLAVRNQAGTWVSYDVNTGNVIDVDPFNMDGSQFMYKMPVALSQVNKGDMIIHNCKPVYVTGKDESGKLVVIDIFDGEEKMILPTRNMFGFNFATKVVSLMDMAGMGKPDAENPFGNMWMLAMMGDGKDFDMKDFMMLNMMNGNVGAQMNPMMMLMLMGDKGQDNDLMMAMAMSGMFNQKQ